MFDRPTQLPTVAYIAGQFPLRSETFVYREVRELRRRGWNVICVTLNDPKDSPEAADDLINGRITVYAPGWLRRAYFAPTEAKKWLSAWKMAFGDFIRPGERTPLLQRMKISLQNDAARGLADKLRKAGVSHIHCHFAHAPTTVGMYAARQLGIPFSFTGHANDLYQRRFLLKKKLRRAKFVSCISLEHRKLYRSLVDRPDEDYPVIRCGVDVNEFAQVSADDREKPATGDGAPAVDATTKMASANPRPWTILTVCRLVEKKGVDTLIRAFAELSQDDSALIIAGDGPERDRLQKLADDVGVANRTTFTGAVSNDAVRKLLRDVDVFALACRVDRKGDKDGIPVVLMEAMASGRPVVAGDLPAIRELVIDNQTGLLVDGHNVASVTAALRRLRADPAVALRLGAGGRDRVVEEFSLAANVSRLEEALLR